mgnify:CR=1 FL=1
MFQTRKKHSPFRNILLSVLIFFAVIGLFYVGTSALSGTSQKEQEKLLQTAMTESAVHFYALNGYYPENLDSLLDNYGITYDKDCFFVDYQPQGENIMPEITVVKKGM